MRSQVVFSLCLALAGAFAASQRPQPTQLSPTVLVLGEFDYVPYKDGTARSRCTDMVKSAAETTASNKLQLVPTFYYFSDPSGDSINRFCWVDTDNTCQPFSQAAIDAFEKGMQTCMAAAIYQHGFEEVTVTPHIDNRDAGDGWTIRTWRNGLVFDPKSKYNGFSYDEILLQPLARAFAPFLSSFGGKPLKRLNFGLQGEMGASVMRYPDQYSALIPDMKEILTGAPTAKEIRSSTDATDGRARKPQLLPDSRGWANLFDLWDEGVERTGGIPVSLSSMSQSYTEESKDDEAQQADHSSSATWQRADSEAEMQARLDRVRFGLSFNFIYADGSQRFTTSVLGQLGVAFVGSFFGFRPGFQAPLLEPKLVEALMYEVDFIGISAYHPLDLDFSMNELQNSVFNVVDGFDAVGIDLDAVLNSPRKGGGNREVLYVEFGVGGGSSQGGQGPASSPRQAIRTPYWGVQGPYRKAKDPWADKSMRSFLHSFYARTFKWLSQGTGPTYTIDACFLWNHGSHDVLGIHPESSTEEGSYKDDTLVRATVLHNSDVRSLVGGGR